MDTQGALSADSVNNTFFNDLSQTTTHQPNSNNAVEGASEADKPRLKRIACILCRKRKLRCDGARPKCGTCSRLSHDCGYDEVRKKSGPKRGYVKLLEQRLQQVETLLQKQPEGTQPAVSQNDFINDPGMNQSPTNDYIQIPPKLQTQNTPVDANNNGQWEMIGLGLQEPLPLTDVCNELNDLFFRVVHPSLPMIHRPRYLAAHNLAPSMRPPICLRYIVWCLAASVSEKYSSLAEEFYRRARKYIEIDEMKGHGEFIITLAHCQTWVLIAWHEFKHLYFPRAWLSSGRASSLALMMGLNRVDGAVLDVKQCLPPPKDWTEKEERRRTFWNCFCADRYASIGTGWALRMDERDAAPSLEQAFSSSGSANISTYASVILIATLLGRNLTHLHRPTPNDNEEDLNGAFWQRHRKLESQLSNICLALPDHLRIPAGLPDTNTIFTNFLLHTSIICLHQAAIFKAEKHSFSQEIIAESRMRCMTAASEITRIMKQIAHLEMATMNPFTSFCLYVAGRVFSQYLKLRPDDQQIYSHLRFLASAMHTLKKRNPLTESFLAQLELDLEGSGIVLGPKTQYVHWNSLQQGCANGDMTKGKGILPGIGNPIGTLGSRDQVPAEGDNVTCVPLFEIRDTQTPIAKTSIFHPKDSFDTQGSVGYTSADGSLNPMAAESPSMSLPNRPKNSPFVARLALYDQMNEHGVPSPASSDMDFSEKSRNTSFRENSSSHSSFSPQSQNEQLRAQTRRNNSTSENSPATVESGSEITTPNMVSAAEAMFFNVSDPTFDQFNTNQMFATPFMGTNDINMTAGWDMSALDIPIGAMSAADQTWSTGGVTTGQAWAGGQQGMNTFDNRHRQSG